MKPKNLPMTGQERIQARNWLRNAGLPDNDIAHILGGVTDSRGIIGNRAVGVCQKLIKVEHGTSRNG